MSVPRLRNLTTGDVVATNVAYARSWWQRLSGLLHHSTISPDDGMWFDKCSAIHTVGMRFTIDAIFLDEERRVIGIRHSVPPNQVVVRHARAHAVVELGATEPGCRPLALGDRLGLE